MPGGELISKASSGGKGATAPPLRYFGNNTEELSNTELLRRPDTVCAPKKASRFVSRTPMGP